MRELVITLLLLCLLSCGSRQPAAQSPQTLPYPVSNHAVAYLHIDGVDQFHVFNGLTENKAYDDITNQAYHWSGDGWQPHQVPSEQPPVLASIAVSIGQHIYLFGGYTVAKDHSEVSTPLVWRIDGHTQIWERMPDMPTPVDDTVALVYQDRYIYLVSGWHDVDNVSLVQVFDIQNKKWSQATPYPLPAVFGHAGGMVGSHMVVCDGVKVAWEGEKKQFLPSPACAMGTIDPDNPLLIHWQDIPHHSGTAFYRMAAGDDENTVLFVGGSDNPYNYNGIGYNDQLSEPSGAIRQFDLSQLSWNIVPSATTPTMDHRGLLKTRHGFAILGGMVSKQQLSDRVIYIEK